MKRITLLLFLIGLAILAAVFLLIFNTFLFKPLFFGFKLNKNLYLWNKNLTKKELLIPANYSLVSEYTYSVFPDYFVLEKNRQLFGFDIKTKKLRKINLGKLNKNNVATIKQSITEKDKFLITINLINSFEKGDYLVDKVYKYSADTNELKEWKGFELPKYPMLGTVYEYDSKYSRLFIWQSGEPIPSMIPLETYDLNTKKREIISSFDDFGVEEVNWWDLIMVHYFDKHFLLVPKNIDEHPNIVIVSVGEKISKKVINIPENLSKKIGVQYAYSASVDEKLNMVVLANHDNIILLHFTKAGLADGVVKLKHKDFLYINYPVIFNHKFLFLFRKDNRTIFNEVNLKEGLVETSSDLGKAESNIFDPIYLFRK